MVIPAGALERDAGALEVADVLRVPEFNRNLGVGVIGPMVRALDRLLSEHPDHVARNR